MMFVRTSPPRFLFSVCSWRRLRVSCGALFVELSSLELGSRKLQFGWASGLYAFPSGDLSLGASGLSLLA